MHTEDHFCSVRRGRNFCPCVKAIRLVVVAMLSWKDCLKNTFRGRNLWPPKIGMAKYLLHVQSNRNCNPESTGRGTSNPKPGDSSSVRHLRAKYSELSWTRRGRRRLCGLQHVSREMTQMWRRKTSDRATAVPSGRYHLSPPLRPQKKSRH